MNPLPVPVASVLRRLRRRLTIGVFLDIWPRWALGSLLSAGVFALSCRLFLPRAASALNWLWLAPVIASIPAMLLTLSRSYRPEQIAALADSLNGGEGTLLAVLEIQDSSWVSSRAIAGFSQFPMPRLRVWRKLCAIVPAAAFLATALMMPQRTTAAAKGMLANDIAADLQATLNELKKQDVITPNEDKQFQDEIERIRKDASEKLDASSWEASDAMREKFAAKLAEKQDAMKWAADSLSNFAAAGDSDASMTKALAGELGTAIDKLAQTGLLANAPGDLQKLLGGKDAIAGGKMQLPKDTASLRKLAASLSKYLAGRSGELAAIGKLGKEAGRFDPTEFPLFSDERGPDGDGDPGSGGINRGRGDADLTWGKESAMSDRFKSVPLPPGSYRSPDDWTPLAVLPGAPKESPEASLASSGIQYAGVTGQAAVRRTLAPRHYSAVKKYFENSK
jgi:hypothetical protein